MKKYALITGGSRGIGFAIAEYLASRGMNLILLAQHEHNLCHAKQSLLERYPDCGITTLAMDMQNVAGVEKGIPALLETSPPCPYW